MSPSDLQRAQLRLPPNRLQRPVLLVHRVITWSTGSKAGPQGARLAYRWDSLAHKVGSIGNVGFTRVKPFAHLALIKTEGHLSNRVTNAFSWAHLVVKRLH